MRTHMRTISFCAIAAIAYMQIFLNSAFAQDDDSWLRSSAPKIDKLIENQNCEGLFNFLWPEAKAGNLDARLRLLILNFSPPHMDGMSMPGRSQDGKLDNDAWLRDINILAFHSAGAESMREAKQDDIYWRVLFYGPESSAPKSVQECFRRNISQECTELVVKEGMIPPFNEYAAEIDNLMAKGAKPDCVFYPDDDEVDTVTPVKDKK